MTLDEYLDRDAVALAALVRRGELAPTELLDLAVARLDAVDPAINAVTTRLVEFAMREIEQGLPDGPFRGVPFLLKDQVDLRGFPTTRACRLLTNHMPRRDSAVVARLRAAGVLIFGKTNMPELGLNVTTEPRMHGATRNPWNKDFTVGGSSGGSAAAVTAGICPAAGATDGGGSIRIPASCCGVFGLKPSRGRISFGPDQGEGWGGMTAHGVITRSVRDTAALLDVLSGPEPGDPYAMASPAGGFARAAGLKPGKLRVAVVRRPPSGVSVLDECREAVDDTVKLLEGLGHDVRAAELPVECASVRDAAGTIIRVKVRQVLEDIATRRGRAINRDEVEAATWMIFQAGADVTATAYARAIEAVHAVGRRMANFMRDHDVVLTPMLAEPPLRLGVLNSDSMDAALFERMRSWSPFNNLFNATGQPAMSVPLHWSRDNLPIGVQFAGRFGEECTLLKLAAQLESARPWWQRYRWLRVG